jgi:glycosyltransferase involved in cell wall biosynthesis
MKKINKIVFITAHNWITKRLGGFHKFAEASCEDGIETVFFSFPRPYYGCFMKTELYNKKSISELVDGIDYKVGYSILHNVTFKTMRLPDSLGKILPDFMMNFFLKSSFSSFKKFSQKYFSNTSVFVFESNDGIVLVDKIKKLFPNAKIVYRPSDPLMFEGAIKRYVKNETNIIKKADLTLLVNDGSINIYKKHIPDFEKTINFKILTNGVDIEPFEKKYPIPEPLNKNNTVLYIGAWEPDWEMLFESAGNNKDLNFIIICPNTPSESIHNKIPEYNNITYIPGIMPNEIPQWMTNCDVFIVPYNKRDGSRISGITAKYFQAMAAKRPIVAYYDTPLLKEIGISVTHSSEEFVKEIRSALRKKKRLYDYNLENKRWSKIKKQFLKYIKEL